MNILHKLVVLAGASASVVLSAVAATTGSYMGAAKSISLSGAEQTLSVQLTAEYDPEDKTYSDVSGVYYYKVGIARNGTASIWIDGCSEDMMDLSVDTDWEDESAPMASFSTYFRYDERLCTETLCVLTSDDWDEEDPGKGVFYICVSGNIGDTCTLHYTTKVIDGEAWEGEEPPAPEGSLDNPKSITPTEAGATYSGQFIDGCYYYTFKAKQGRAYRFRTVGGTEANKLDVSFYSSSSTPTPEVVADGTAAVGACDKAIEIRVRADGSIVVCAAGDGTSFSLYGQLVPCRAIGEHEVTELTEENAYTATFVPGRLSALTNCWDPVIDERLFKLPLEAGRRCIFEVSGATTNLLMRVYDANGGILEECEDLAGDLNPYVAMTAAAGGDCYVGLCQKGLEVTETPGADPVTLVAKLVPAAQDGVPDEWDAADDTADGATAIEPTISNDSTDPLAVEGQGGHRLALSDWADCFKVTCQKGITYKFATSTKAATAYSLLGTVFRRTTSKAGVVTETVVTSGPLPEAGVFFKATSSGDHYLRVTVREGMGREYPTYALHAIAYVPSARIGWLTVNIKGSSSARWTYTNTVGSDGVKRQGGEKVLTWGSNTIAFTDVKGYTTPDKQTYVMTGDAAADVVWGVYNDTSDPGDDYTSGTIPGTKKSYQPVKIAPSAKGVTAERSLYAEDVADWFKFDGKAGVYYRFSLSEKTGDAIVRVYDPADLENPLPNVNNEDPDAWQVLVEKKGTYYVCVSHGEEEPLDGSYVLTATCANVGTVKVDKTAVSVSESAAYVDLSVSRSANEGSVSVNFTTKDGTALAGGEYYPTNGVLTWANGDKKAKTVRVRLIPDLYPTYEPDKVFTFEITPVEGPYEAGEYPASIVAGLATVTVRESTKAAPGTVGVVSCRDDSSSEELEMTSKNTAVTALDNSGSLTFELARTGGADGRIAVRVQTVDGTAKARDDDYGAVDRTLVWEDGETSNKAVTVSVGELGDPAVVSKNFKLKLTAEKKVDGQAVSTAKIGTSAVTVTLRNSEVVLTGEELSKGLGAVEGLSLKTGKAGTWYVDNDGALKSVELGKGDKAELTFTLAGPGVFGFTPNMTGSGTLNYTVGKQTTAIDEWAVVCLLVPAGTTTVKISAAGTSDADPAVAALEPSEGSPAFFWRSLANVTAITPTDKAAILPTDGGVKLSWDAPEDAAEYGLVYRVSVAEKAKDLATDAALVTSGTLDEPVYDCGAAFDLEPGRTYYWRVDYALDSVEGLDWTVPKTVWSFTTTAAGAAVPTVAEGAADSYGNPIAAGKTVGLMQGVKIDFALASDAKGTASYSVTSGKLPDGVKLVADKKAGRTTVSGVPTKTGDYTALICVKDGKTAGATETLTFHVEPLELGAGTFNGVLTHDAESAAVDGMAELASVAFTATEKGALSAKVQLGGKSYAFKATGYDRVKVGEDEDDDEYLDVALEQIQKVGKQSFTNALYLTVLRDAVDESGMAASGSVVDATLRMTALATDKVGGAVREWTGGLYRDNTKLPAVVAEQDAFVGYYTVALCPPAGTDAKVAPAGNGYLTLTVAKGTVKVSGKLADGTAVSGSVPGALGPSGVGGEGSTTLDVPLFYAKSGVVFGGTLVLKAVAGGVVADTARTLVWNNDNATSTYAGEEGFKLKLSPTGGYYDTVLNLQRYYLDNRFWFDVSDDLPEEILASGYRFSKYCLPNDEKNLGVTLTGNEPSVDKRQLVKVTGSKTLYDLGLSVNPWNVTVKFKRATGILSGTLSVWTETTDGSKQKEITGLKHEGVLLLSREDAGPLSVQAWTAGSYLVPTSWKEGGKTRKWTCALPFNILTAVESAAE